MGRIRFPPFDEARGKNLRPFIELFLTQDDLAQAHVGALIIVCHVYLVCFQQRPECSEGPPESCGGEACGGIVPHVGCAMKRRVESRGGRLSRITALRVEKALDRADELGALRDIESPGDFVLNALGGAGLRDQKAGGSADHDSFAFRKLGKQARCCRSFFRENLV